MFIIIEYLSEKRSKLYLIHDLECSIASLLWCFRYDDSIDGTSVKDAGMTDRATLNGTPVGLEELGEVFACLLQLVLVQDDVKHLL